MIWILVAWGIITAAVVLAVFGYLYLGGRRLAPEEEGLEPIYHEQCGGRFDNSWNFTIPFVRFSVYKGFLVVACGGNKHVLPFQDIQEVSAKRHLFSKGIYIKHSRRDIPSIIIWSMDVRRAMTVLQEQGITIGSA